MKKSDIRQIIKEEVVQLIREQYITEAFADPLLRTLANTRGMGNNKWNSFFTKFANTHDIAWDKLPKGSVTKSTNMNDPRVKNGLVFWMIDQEKRNPYAGQNWYMSSILYPGVLAVTLNGKIQYMGGDKVGMKSRRMDSPVGQGTRGMLMVKKLKDTADSLLTMDFENFRGGTSAMKAKRADLKLGKDTFTDHKAWKRANLDRYKDILNARVGSRDQVDKMVGEIVKMANEAVKTGMEVVKMGKYDRMMTTVSGNEVELEVVANAMTRTLRLYAQYIKYANDAEKEKEQGYGGDYYDKAFKQTAGDIKKLHVAFKQGNASNISRY